MKIDTGLVIVILAVLIFYLRLIILQRERARRVRKIQAGLRQKARKNESASRSSTGAFSILSKNWIDLGIAAAGVLAIVAGVLLNARLFGSPELQTLWWLPTALGIVAFSWAFKL